jgi:hypothetical protein
MFFFKLAAGTALEACAPELRMSLQIRALLDPQQISTLPHIVSISLLKVRKLIVDTLYHFDDSELD